MLQLAHCLGRRCRKWLAFAQIVPYLQVSHLLRVGVFIIDLMMVKSAIVCEKTPYGL